jgi:arylsulfatase A-like enzyme
MVLSDHGHSPTVIHKLETQHRHGPPGAFFAFGGPFRKGHAVAGGPSRRDHVLAGVAGGGAQAPHVLDVAPTVLALLGLPVAEDMPGRVLEELFAPDALPGAGAAPRARRSPPTRACGSRGSATSAATAGSTRPRSRSCASWATSCR